MPAKKSPEKAQALLAAAGAVFARHGYRSATIDQVAEAAGVAKGTVYLYFASKEDLFFALFEEMARQAMASLPDLAAASDKPALKRIEALFRAVGESLDANEAIIPLTLEFWSASGVAETKARFGGAFAEMFAEFRAALTAILKDGAAKGEIRKDAARAEVASCLMAMIDGLIIQQWTDPRIRLADVFGKALPVLLRGLKA
ncbi:MAG: TetR/AcrR family transcriptional regulator [Parvularculaceae bacterium]